MDVIDLNLLNLAGAAAGETYSETRNPLEDDALALRLAVKLRLCIDRCPEDVARYVRAWRPGTEVVEAPVSVMEEYEAKGDPLAATRRAIVRAAAAIGRAS